MQVRKKQSLRILSGFLAASMVLSAFPTAAFAAAPADTTTSPSAVTQSEETGTKIITTLKVTADGTPIGSGNAETEGWTFGDNNILYIYAGWTMDSDITVKRAVVNNGTIANGTFTWQVKNQLGAVIKGGTFEDSVENSGRFEGGTVEGKGNFYNLSGGVVTGGRIMDVLHNYVGATIESGTFGMILNSGTIAGGMIDAVQNIEDTTVGEGATKQVGTITGGVFGQIDENVMGERNLIIENEDEYNEFEIEGLESINHHLYFFGTPDIKITYKGNKEEFEKWKATPECSKWNVSNGGKTVELTLPDADVILTPMETLHDLTFENGKPVGNGNRTSGWTYEIENDVEKLTLYQNYNFDQKDAEVNCYVDNYGTISAGTFKESVSNSGTIAAGTFDDVLNYGTISGGKFENAYNTETGTISNADIAKLNANESSSVTDSVFGLSFLADAPEGARILSFANGAQATVNDVIKVDSDNHNVYVMGNRPVKVTYTGDLDGFDGWVATPEAGMTKTDDATVEFASLNSDVMLTAKEKAMDLEFGTDGLPTKKGNKTSGWSYSDEYSNPVLTFYDGYTFDGKDQVVNCTVVNYGTIESGIFKQHVTNSGTISDGIFTAPVDNYDYVEGQEKAGTISGGVFANLSSKNLPENTYMLTAVGCTINDEIQNGAFVVGKGYPITVKVPDSNTDFESWKAADEITTEGMTSRTLTFAMPEKDVTLETNYKDNPLEFDANGVPTHLGGKNWEYIQSEEQNVLTLHDGAVLDTNVTVKCPVVVYPGGVIKNGSFDAYVINVGVIEGGTFNKSNNGGVQNFGTIQSGTFEAPVTNINIQLDPGQQLGGTLESIVKLLGVTECDGRISGGTFNGYVMNSGIISDGTFTERVYNEPISYLMGGENNLKYTSTTEIKGGTFKAEVRNKCDITGGTFEEKVLNAGEISGGVFKKDVENTTAEKIDDTNPATLSLMSMDAVDAIDLQNDTNSATSGTVGIITDGIFEGKVLNEGVIEGGTYNGAVENATTGKIKDGLFKSVVTNTGDGEITGGDFTGKVENNGKPITGGVFAEKPTGTADDVKLYTLNVPEGCTIDGKDANKITSVKGQSFEVEYTGSDFSEWEITGAELANTKANPVTVTLDSSDVTLTVKNAESKPTTPTTPDKPSEPSNPGETEKPGEDKPSTPTTPSDKPSTDPSTKPGEGETENPSKPDEKPSTPETPTEPSKPSEGDKPSTDPSKPSTPSEGDKPSTDPSTPSEGDKPSTDPSKPSTPTEPEKPQQPEQSDSGAGALLVGGALVAGGVATGVIVYNVAMDIIKSALPEGAAIPETREQLAVSLWEKAGKPEVTVEEGVTLTDTEKAMRWAVENQLISAEGEESVSKIDVLVAAYKAKNL